MSPRRTPDVPAATSTTTRSARSLRALRLQAPKAYDPGATFRKERKVLDAGARVEVKLVDLLNGRKVNRGGISVVCWRRPGVKARRLSGVTYYPDAAGFVPELADLVPVLRAQVADRPEFNALFEFKGQSTTGSAEKKIGPAIVDLAHTCDTLGTVGAVILDTPVLTDAQIIDFKCLGRLHSVVVLTAEEVRTGALVPALVAVAKERRRLRRRLTSRGGYVPTKRPPIPERGLAYRVTQRKLMARELRRYAQVHLVR